MRTPRQSRGLALTEARDGFRARRGWRRHDQQCVLQQPSPVGSRLGPQLVGEGRNQVVTALQPIPETTEEPPALGCRKGSGLTAEGQFVCY
jgi:hypothetical protein